MNLITFQKIVREAMLKTIADGHPEGSAPYHNGFDRILSEAVDKASPELKKTRIDTLRESCAEIAKIQDGFRGLKKSAATFQEREHAENIVGILGDCIRNIAKKMDEPS